MKYPWLFDPHQVLARTIWGENRSGGYVGMQSVANVVMNRVHKPRWWGSSVLGVCLKPWQFSTWNALTADSNQDANYDATVSAGVETAGFIDALNIAQLAIGAALPDLTEGADSYFALSLDKPPAWIKGATHTMDIAGQSFWRTV